jgi:hypothetical protein
MSASSATDWLNEDGTAKDPSGYKELLRSDPERWAKIEQHPEAAAIILGDDIDAFQELLKAASEVWGSFACCTKVLCTASVTSTPKCFTLLRVVSPVNPSYDILICDAEL